MHDDHRPVRAALVAGITFGLAHLVAIPLLRPEQVGVATDVYYLAAETVLAGDSPYFASPPDHPGFQFLYQPVVVLAFVPHALTGSALGAYALQSVLNLATAGAIALLLVRTIETDSVRLARVDRLLVAGFAVASVHSVVVVAMGQVNLQLALAIVAGAVLIDSGRPWIAGGAFAAAATVKLFPAVVGVWLLRQRAWRTIAAATVTGISLVLAGVLVFGVSLFETFLTGVLPAERHATEFAGGLPPSAMFVTLRRPLAALFPATDPAILAVAALAVLVPVVVAGSWDVSTRRGRMIALLATLLGTMLYLPLEPFYFSLVYYPLVPLLYLLDPGRVRKLFLGGTVLLSAVVSYPAIAGLLALAPLGQSLSSTLATGTEAVFRFAQPPLLGGLLLLTGCVLFQYQTAADGVGADTADPAVE